jgi:hypothetical protein
MANYTLQNIFDASRGYLNDVQVPGGETYSNQFLQIHFNEAWRRMWRAVSNGGSQRVQRFVYVNLPAQTTVLIPETYNITDFAEPTYIEERPAQGTQAIASTDTSTPIKVTFTAPHGLTGAGGYCIISGVAGTTSPWGQWGFTVVNSTQISLNGSLGDVAGTGGVFTIPSVLKWSEVMPQDRANQCIDGIPQISLGCYLWTNEQLVFRGSSGITQLRITYWSSGTPPVLANQHVGIDDCLDFVACVTAANAANANGWYPAADRLRNIAFGQSQDPDEMGGLLLEFINLQVKSKQRGPAIRRGPFRLIRGRWGSAVIGG